MEGSNIKHNSNANIKQKQFAQEEVFENIKKEPLFRKNILN